MLEELEILFPPLPVQRRIAEALGRYDALIENYQRQIGLLEAMAQEVYREWFVRGRCPYAQAQAGEFSVGWERKKLESQVYPDHVRALLSLRPAQTLSAVIHTIKTNASGECNQQLGLAAPLWARGYLARGVGRVSLSIVKQYLNQQSEHHGYDKRVRPPIFRYRTEEPVSLSVAHAAFELTADWHRNEQLRRSVNKMIGDLLHDKLPASYDKPTFKQKQEAVYTQVYDIASRGQAYWM